MDALAQFIADNSLVIVLSIIIVGHLWKKAKKRPDIKLANSMKDNKKQLRNMIVAFAIAIPVLIISSSLIDDWKLQNKLNSLGYFKLIFQDQPEKYAPVVQVFAKEVSKTPISPQENIIFKRLIKDANASVIDYYLKHTSDEAAVVYNNATLSIMQGLRVSPDLCASWMEGITSPELENFITEKNILSYKNAFETIVAHAIAKPQNTTSKETYENLLSTITKKVKAWSVDSSIDHLKGDRKKCEVYITLLEEIETLAPSEVGSFYRYSPTN